MPDSPKPRSPQTVIAFDFGTKKIGVAVGQSITCSASPLPMLKARDGIPDWNQIERLLREWQPDRVVVGLPLNMDDSENELTVRAKKFANRVHGRFGLPVEMMDERLSTREAKELAFAMGHQGNFSENPVDSLAARLILESWWRLKN